MWDEESGTFLAVKRDTLEKIRVATIGSWMPLMAEVPTPAMAERMAEAFMTEHWQTPLPIPTVDRKDQPLEIGQLLARRRLAGPELPGRLRFRPNGYRRDRRRHPDKTVANALKNGINEHYDSMTGKPLGVPYNGMTCTVVTMMLDGLTRQYALKAKSGSEEDYK